MSATITIKDYPCGSGKTTTMIKSFKEEEKYLVILPYLSEVDRVILKSKPVKFVQPTAEENSLSNKTDSISAGLLDGLADSASGNSTPLYPIYIYI